MRDATATLAPPQRRRPHPPRTGPVVDEHDLYPVHEEDNVPEKPLHEIISRYLRYALDAYLPSRWVTGDICMYWDPQDKQTYAAPDVLVVDSVPPDPLPSNYLRWQDPPALLVAEIGSKSTFLRDEGPKPAIYGWHLGVPEYLYYHPDRRELHLYRLNGTGYREVDPVDGRVYSETLGVWFGADETGRLWVYTPGGERLLTHEETERARQEAEARARQEAAARADLERQVAELQEQLRRVQSDRASDAGETDE